MILIGVDIGGTFTDFVSYDTTTKDILSFKLLSTPDNVSKAVIQGIHQISKRYSEDNLNITCIHGSTVATNALLERKGAKTALITTLGFRDILQIRRQNRSELYNLFVESPKPLIPEHLLYEATERIDSKGNIIIPLDPKEIEEILISIEDQEIESVAVSLIFSFLHPEHEALIAKKLADHGFHISISSEILPEFREYERTSTTVINAYVSPILERYLEQLSQQLEDIHLRVMQSNGGMISLSQAQKNGVRCILSGPAGGVIGADFIAKTLSHNRLTKTSEDEERVKLITFDMGGTSTDVSLIDGSPRLTSDAIIDGNPIRIPMLDIHTIGAGGGSIAYLDKGGALRVGPMSAGAYPGPACYGKGNLPTVTDANVVLGRINPNLFLGGKMPIDKSRAIQALALIANELGMDIYRAALGVIDVVNAHMTRALRVISVERGYDPKDFSLFSFGGAGGLHASDLARSVGIQRIIISPYASTLSALGMLTTDVIKDYVQTVMLPGDTPFIELNKKFNPIIRRAFEELISEGIHKGDIDYQKSLDIRYQGQSYELNVPSTPDLLDSFENIHRTLYGYSNPTFATEIVNLRVRAVGKILNPELISQARSATHAVPALLGYQKIVFGQGEHETPIYQGEMLKFGDHLTGPAIIIRSDTTILLNQNDQCEIDPYLNMIIKK